MKSSYKFALIGAVVVCVAILGLSMLGRDGGTPSDPEPPTPDPRAALPPLTQPTPSRPADSTPPSPSTATPEPARPGMGDLFDRVRQSVETAEATATVPSDPSSPSTGMAAEATPQDDPLASADTAADGVIDHDAEPGRPVTPTTLTFGGDESPADRVAEPVRPTDRSVQPTVPTVVDGSRPATTATATSPSTPASTTTTTRTTTPATASDAPQTYEIQSGDTFSAIAIRYYGSDRYWIDIAQANPLVDPHRLRVGQTIRLPAASALAASESAPALPGPGSTYTVRSGDTLSSIANRFYNDPSLWQVIYRANRDKIGSNPDRLTVGHELTIPDRP